MDEALTGAVWPVRYSRECHKIGMAGAMENGAQVEESSKAIKKLVPIRPNVAASSPCLFGWFGRWEVRVPGEDGGGMVPFRKGEHLDVPDEGISQGRI